MIVIDASALFHLLGGSSVGRRIAERIGSEALHAPHLVDLETTQVLRRLVLVGELSEERAMFMLDALTQLDLNRYPHDPLLTRIWALRHNMTAYDAAYVALAEALDCSLVTCDGRLARVPGLQASIELFEV